MSYSFNPAEPIAINLQAIGREQIDRALASLDTIKKEPDEAIHDIRKRLKKLRALIRLCRVEMDKEYYKERNTSFRDVGRKLSKLRNLTSMQDSLQALHDRYSLGLKAQVFKGVVRQLEKEKQEELHEKIEEGSLVAELKQVLEAEKAELKHWPVGNDQLYQFVPALRKVYERGYKACKTARKKPDAAIKHEWRKRVKYLWYHFRLLKAVWPGMWKQYAREWHRLGHVLGNDHDLAVLKQKLQEEAIMENEAIACNLLDSLIVKEIALCDEEAFILGRRLFAEDPEAFGKRIKKIMKAGGEALHHK